MSRFVFFIYVFILFFISSCGTTPQKEPEKVTLSVPLNTAPPKINGLVDLGALDIQLGSTQLPLDMSDTRISPGEWLMVRGTNLGAKSIKIDGKEVDVGMYFDGQVIVRVPTRLSPPKNTS